MHDPPHAAGDRFAVARADKSARDGRDPAGEGESRVLLRMCDRIRRDNGIVCAVVDGERVSPAVELDRSIRVAVSD